MSKTKTSSKSKGAKAAKADAGMIGNKRIYDDHELWNLIENGEVSFTFEWDTLKTVEPEGKSKTSYLKVMLVGEGGEPVHFEIRTPLIQMSRMTKPGEGYQSLTRPSCSAYAGLGRSADFTKGDTTVYDGKIRMAIAEALEEYLTENPAAKAARPFMKSGKPKPFMDSWCKTHRGDKAKFGAGEEYEDGPLITFQLTNFTEYFDGFDIAKDPDTGVTKFGALKFRGKPVKTANVYKVLCKSGVVATPSYSVQAVSSSMGISFQAQTNKLVAYPGTGSETQSRTGEQLAGNMVDDELLAAMRAKMALAPADSGSDSDADSDADSEAGDAGSDGESEADSDAEGEAESDAGSDYEVEEEEEEEGPAPVKTGKAERSRSLAASAMKKKGKK